METELDFMGIVLISGLMMALFTGVFLGLSKEEVSLDTYSCDELKKSLITNEKLVRNAYLPLSITDKYNMKTIERAYKYKCNKHPK